MAYKRDPLSPDLNLECNLHLEENGKRKNRSLEMFVLKLFCCEKLVFFKLNNLCSLIWHNKLIAVFFHSLLDGLHNLNEEKT